MLPPCCAVLSCPTSHPAPQGNFTFTAELIVALIAFITAVWLSLYMGWWVTSRPWSVVVSARIAGGSGRQAKLARAPRDSCAHQTLPLPLSLPLPPPTQNNHNNRAVHSLRLIPRFTNTLLGCCGREYEVRCGWVCVSGVLAALTTSRRHLWSMSENCFGPTHLPVHGRSFCQMHSNCCQMHSQYLQDVYYEGEEDPARGASRKASEAAMEEGQVRAGSVAVQCTGAESTSCLQGVASRPPLAACSCFAARTNTHARLLPLPCQPSGGASRTAWAPPPSPSCSSSSSRRSCPPCLASSAP